jgi:hypothetical protein
MREATICKIEGDDEFYHLEAAPSPIMGNDDPRYIAMSCDTTTYCDKKVVSRPHEWIDVPYGTHVNLRVDFTWSKLKPCPVCEKNRKEDERSAWGY